MNFVTVLVHACSTFYDPPSLSVYTYTVQADYLSATEGVFAFAHVHTCCRVNK